MAVSEEGNERDLRKQQAVKIANGPGEPIPISGTITSEQGPTQFVLDAANVEVEKDTANAGNNKPLPVREQQATGQTTTTVVASAASVQLVPANAIRLEAIIRNNTSKKMFVCLFTPATTVTPIVLQKQEIFILRPYSGPIYAIWEAGVTGSAEITEINE